MWTAEDLKHSPNDVSSACLDENINIYQIPKYFCASAWKKLFITMIRNGGWLYQVCNKDVDTQSSQLHFYML